MKGTRKNEQRVRLDSRKILLKTLVDLESNRPTDAFKVDRQAQDYLVSNRMALQTTFKTLEKAKEEFGLASVDFVQQVTELNIAGIYVRTKTGESFNVEVLDETNTLNDNKTPFGLMRLKQEILDKKGSDFVLVNIAGVAGQEEIEQIVKDGVRNFLGDNSSGSGQDLTDKGETEPVSVKT